MQDLLAPLAEASEPSRTFQAISEVAEQLDVPQHVLRFWESRFSQIKPTKSRGGRRYYRPEDVEVLKEIKRLLYQEGYTIEGARKALAGHAKPGAAAKKTADVGTVRREAQLAVIRQELMALSDMLKKHLG